MFDMAVIQIPPTFSPAQITDDQARAIHAALDPDAATTAHNKEN